VPASVHVPGGGAAARGCQARRHDVEDNVVSGCQAPPVNAPLARRRAAVGRADALELLFSRPHPPPTRPRKATSGRARRDFPRGRSDRWHSRLIVVRRLCWKREAWRVRPGTAYREGRTTRQPGCVCRLWCTRLACMMENPKSESRFQKTHGRHPGLAKASAGRRYECLTCGDTEGGPRPTLLRAHNLCGLVGWASAHLQGPSRDLRRLGKRSHWKWSGEPFAPAAR